MLAAPDERVETITRHRFGAAAHLLPIGRLPPALTEPPDRAVMVTPLSARFDPAHDVTKRFAALYSIECMLLLPPPDRLGLLWIGKRGLDPFTDEQTGASRRSRRVPPTRSGSRSRTTSS